ncbi:hypothetical protein GS907_24465 [Rhodococcus hoagii]|nr:hypothetical protein [Prescottella equi]
MSTAEQIIAEHPWSWELDDIGSDIVMCKCGEVFASPLQHAAHVVAELTNAGHIEVEYSVERGVVEGGREVVAGIWSRAEAESMAQQWPQRLPNSNPVVVQRRVFYGEWEPAAARVAEGGDQP